MNAPDRSIEICLSLTTPFGKMPTNANELSALLQEPLRGKLPVCNNEEDKVCDTISLPMAIYCLHLQLNFSFSSILVFLLISKSLYGFHRLPEQFSGTYHLNTVFDLHHQYSRNHHRGHDAPSHRHSGSRDISTVSRQFEVIELHC